MRVRFGSFVLDFEARQLERGGHPVHLTPKALELLELLVERRPNAVSKAEIHDRLWPDTFVADVNLPVLVHELREALEDDPHEPRLPADGDALRLRLLRAPPARSRRPRSGRPRCPYEYRLIWGVEGDRAPAGGQPARPHPRRHHLGGPLERVAPARARPRHRGRGDDRGLREQERDVRRRRPRWRGRRRCRTGTASCSAAPCSSSAASRGDRSSTATDAGASRPTAPLPPATCARAPAPHSHV